MSLRKVGNSLKILAYGERNPFLPSCTVFYLDKAQAKVCRPIFDRIKKGSKSLKIRPILKLASSIKELEAIFSMEKSKLTEIFVNPQKTTVTQPLNLRIDPRINAKFETLKTNFNPTQQFCIKSMLSSK